VPIILRRVGVDVNSVAEEIGSRGSSGGIAGLLWKVPKPGHEDSPI
jgi:hypothetical protein